MNQRNMTTKKNTLKSLISIAAFACTIFAGTLTAEVVKSEQIQRGLDPLILAIVDGFENEKLITAKEYTSTRTLKPRPVFFRQFFATVRRVRRVDLRCIEPLNF